MVSRVGVVGRGWQRLWQGSFQGAWPHILLENSAQQFHIPHSSFGGKYIGLQFYKLKVRLP